MKKQTLGQFYTTNVDYILQHTSVPKDVPIIEPFAGNGDLVRWAGVPGIECYDIDPKHSYIVRRNTILDPPTYTGKFVLTNPPYLARNKSANKTAFDKYDTNDLYKCVFQEWIQTADNRPIGGILIVPLNFWSSIRKSDVELRASFLRLYSIAQLNIFEESVFDDTSTTVCAFQFWAGPSTGPIPVCIFPKNTRIQFEFSEQNAYTIGGEIYQLPTRNRHTITRLTSRNMDKPHTNILVKCIDDSATRRIGWSYDTNPYIDKTPNQSARTYATLVITPPISEETQKKTVEECNRLLDAFREKYNSLFLANYRESKDIARKRISFDLVYLITEHVLDRDHHDTN